MKTPSLVGLLIIFFVLSGSFPALSMDIEIPKKKIELVKNKLKKTEDSVLKKVIVDGELHYLIGSSMEKDTVDSDQETREYLSMFNKHEILVRMSRERDEKNIDVQLKGVRDIDYYQDSGRAYLLTIVKRKNIVVVDKAGLGGENQGDTTLEALAKMRQKIEERMKNGKASLAEHKKLYDIYLLLGEVEKASEMMGRLMELKFNQ
jgi:hypothetical protein